MNKKDISKRLSEYRQKGAIVLNFNTSKKMQGHMHGHPDHEILTANGYLILIEDKLGNDTMRPSQIEYKKAIKKLEEKTDRVVYFNITNEDSLEMVIDYINDVLEMR